MAENVLDRAGEAALYRALRRFWHPVLWADEVGDRPVAAVLLDEPLAIVRLAGEVRAFKDLCVHRGTALSLGWVDDGHLVCAYHGWTYDPDGVCTRIPASHGTNIPNKARIVRYQAVEHAGLIWVCLDDDAPAMPLPAFPEWADEAYRKIKIPQYDWHCQRGTAGRELRRLQPLRVGPRGHPGRSLEARDTGPRRRPRRDHARVRAGHRGARDGGQGRLG